MEEDWRAVEDEAKRNEMSKNLKFVTFIAKFCLTSVVTTVSIYTMIQLLFIDFDKNSKNKPLYVPSTFFYETQSRPIYEITWVSQLMATYMTGIVYMNYDAFFIILVMHLCGQLNVLKLNIKDLVLQSKKQTFNKTIEAIVQRHLQLKR